MSCSIVIEDASAIVSLPNDPQALKRMVLDLTQREYERTRERDELRSQKQQLENHARELELKKQAIEIEKLRLEVELLRLRKLYYGPRADRLLSLGDVNQLLLEFATGLEKRPVNPQDVPEVPGEEVSTTRRVRRGASQSGSL